MFNYANVGAQRQAAELGDVDVRADLLHAASKDPAMLIWLDTNQSKKGMPNENYAREIMELFSLGVGNYSEQDVKEAARAAGFHEVGIARAEPLDPAPLDRMLARGFEADMAWLRTQRDVRLDPRLLLPGARSVVDLALGLIVFELGHRLDLKWLARNRWLAGSGRA